MFIVRALFCVGACGAASELVDGAQNALWAGSQRRTAAVVSTR